MEKKENIKKIIACGVALFCVVTAGITSAVKLGKNPGESNQLEVPLPDNGGAEIDLEAGVNNGVKLTAVKLAASQYSEYGVSAQAETAYTLTATIYPEDASNKAVDWTIAFANAASTWASGKTVTNYATVTPTSDGALTAVVENIEEFGEQIIVKATSRDNASAYATCTVEYLQRTTGYTFGIHGNFHYEVSSTKTTAAITPNFSSAPSGNISLTVNKSTVYTRANTDKSGYYTMKPTEAFKTAITNAGFSASALKEYSGTSGSISNYFDSEWGTALYGSDNAKKNALIAAIDGYSGNAYEVIMYESNGGAELATFYVTLDASELTGQKGVESIVIDQTEIVF